MAGLPGNMRGDKRLVGLVHWVNLLAFFRRDNSTVQGCHCRRTWDYQAAYLDARETYTGCTDIESPVLRDYAVGDGCGNDSSDPDAGYSEGKLGWTKWDVRRAASSSHGRLGAHPSTEPYVRTEHGCQCHHGQDRAAETGVVGPSSLANDLGCTLHGARL